MTSSPTSSPTRRAATHLIAAMSEPLPEALAALETVQARRQHRPGADAGRPRRPGGDRHQPEPRLSQRRGRRVDARHGDRRRPRAARRHHRGGRAARRPGHPPQARRPAHLRRRHQPHRTSTPGRSRSSSSCSTANWARSPRCTAATGSTSDLPVRGWAPRRARSRGWRWWRALPSAAPASGCWSWTGWWPSGAPTSTCPPARRGSSRAAPTCGCHAWWASARRGRRSCSSAPSRPMPPMAG